MSLALPLARSVSHDPVRRPGSPGLGSRRSPSFCSRSQPSRTPGAWRRRHLVASGDGRMDHRPWGRAARRPVQPLDARARRGSRTNGCPKSSMTLAFRVGGWSGVVFLTGAAAARRGLGRRPRRRGARSSRRAAGRDGRPRPWARNSEPACAPPLLALPLMVAWFAALLAAPDRGGAPWLGLAALIALWANLHGGFIFGLVLVAPVALEALMDAAAGTRLATVRAWGLFGSRLVGGGAPHSLWRRSGPPVPFRLMAVRCSVGDGVPAGRFRQARHLRLPLPVARHWVCRCCGASPN